MSSRGGGEAVDIHDLVASIGGTVEEIRMISPRDKMIGDLQHERSIRMGELAELRDQIAQAEQQADGIRARIHGINGALDALSSLPDDPQAGEVVHPLVDQQDEDGPK